MDREDARMRALGFLYARYEKFGHEPHMISAEELTEAVNTTGVAEADLRRAFRELSEDGLAEGHPGPGSRMHPEDGLVWITPAGRRRIKERPARTVLDEQTRAFQRRQDVTLPDPETRERLESSRPQWKDAPSQGNQQARQRRLVQANSPPQAEPLSTFHPRVVAVAGPLFRGGYFRQSIFEAWLELNKAVQEKSGRHDLDGTALMQEVFSPKDPVLKFEGHSDE
jgi:hypothetical protein